MIKRNIKCMQREDAYIFEYPVALEFADAQNDVVWPWKEPQVENDIHDFMTATTPQEQHGIIETLKLFTKYECFVGNDYWGGRVYRMFPRACIRTMANCFSYFEINVHARFYNALNSALHLDTKEFHESYKDDPVLADRMNFLDKMVSDKDDLVSLGVFSMVEGAILYSAFAFFKHFQSNGKNKLVNVNRGINFSVRDENLHSLGGAWLYSLVKEELRHLNDDSEEVNQYFIEVEEKIRKAAEKLIEHEFRITDKIYLKDESKGLTGKIEGITITQHKHFIESRVNECLSHLGINQIRSVAYNPIKEWFYDGINSYQMNDFFTGVGNEYNRNWSEEAFQWDTTLTKVEDILI